LFPCISVNQFNIYTPDNFEYKYASIAPHNHHFTFYVKACHDTHLFLQSEAFADVNDESDGYQIVIGGYENSKSHIRDGRGVSLPYV
jgi:hypothetical protein